MNDKQKLIVREILRGCFNYGFAASHPLKPIAEKHGFKVADIYDPNTEKGLLAEYGNSGNGFLWFTGKVPNVNVSVSLDTHELLCNWSDFQP